MRLAWAGVSSSSRRAPRPTGLKRSSSSSFRRKLRTSRATSPSPSKLLRLTTQLTPTSSFTARSRRSARSAWAKPSNPRARRYPSPTPSTLTLIWPKTRHSVASAAPRPSPLVVRLGVMPTARAWAATSNK